MANKRLLMVTREFPPTGGVGVERVTKYAKYLPDFDWEPTVLTGKSGSYGYGLDHNLAKDVENTSILRCHAPDLYAMYMKIKSLYSSGAKNVEKSTIRNYKSRGPWHPKSLIVPDSQVMWTVPAVFTALRNYRKYNWDAIYVTISPPTNALVGYVLSRWLKLPLLIDYRDPWTNTYFSPRRIRPLAALENYMEDVIFASASSITALDPICVARPKSNAKKIPPIKIISNGYDDSDFKNCVQKKLPAWSIVHTGNLNSYRSLKPIWDIINDVFLNNPELKGDLHFWQIGTIDSVVEKELSEPPEGLIVHYRPPVTMKEAIEYMLGANILLAYSAINDKNTPGKIYQYMRANRPILAICEEGAESFKNTVLDANIRHICQRSDYKSASKFLLAVTSDDVESYKSTEPKIEKYSRYDLTREFAGVLSVMYASS